MADDRQILRQAQEHAPKVLPKPIARLVTDELRRGFMAAAARLHYPEYGELARAVLALPVPAPAVDREGLIGLIADSSNHNPFPEAADIADTLIDADLVRGASLARGLADVAAGRVQRRDDFLDEQDGDGGTAEIDLAGIKRVIEAVDDTRRYIQVCIDAGDSWDGIPDDYVARSALASWQGNPPWLSDRETAMQARIDAAVALIDARDERGYRTTDNLTLLEQVRAELTDEGESKE